jgi:hypothetical protein
MSQIKLELTELRSHPSSPAEVMTWFACAAQLSASNTLVAIQHSDARGGAWCVEKSTRFWRRANFCLVVVSLCVRGALRLGFGIDFT